MRVTLFEAVWKLTKEMILSLSLLLTQTYRYVTAAVNQTFL